MVNSRDVAAFSALRAAGATMDEITVLLSVIAEVNTSQRLIDLGSKVWEHEARGKGGKWVRGNPVLHPALQVQSGAAIRPEHDPAETKLADKPASMRQLAHVHQQSLAAAHEAAQTAAKHAVDQAMKIHQEAERQADAEEKKKSNTKFWAVLSSIVGGAVLGGIMAKTGLPDPAIIAASITPAAAEALFERHKQL